MPPKKIILNSDSRAIIQNVIEKCYSEAKEEKIHLGRYMKRTAEYTRASKDSIRRICKESACKFELSVDPQRTTSIYIDNFDVQILQEIIKTYCIKHKKVPSLSEILSIVQQRLDFLGTRTKLRRFLKRIGFVWKIGTGKQKVMLEKPLNVFRRIHYLEKIGHFQNTAHRIFYLDETWVSNDFLFKKYWHREFSKSATNIDKLFLILTVGSKDGILENTRQIFMHSDEGPFPKFTQEKFQDWIMIKLLPNLPADSVLVAENIHHHNLLLLNVPNKYSSKLKMLEWLTEQNISCDKNMSKSMLYKLISDHRPSEKKYFFDNMLETHGHILLRLPLHMYSLHPFELAWVEVKYQLGSCIPYSTFSVRKRSEIVLEIFNEITPEQWVIFYQQIETLRMKCLAQDNLYLETLDKILYESGKFIDESDSHSSDFISDTDSD